MPRDDAANGADWLMVPLAETTKLPTSINPEAEAEHHPNEDTSVDMLGSQVKWTPPEVRLMTPKITSAAPTIQNSTLGVMVLEE
jgi:hypothetical protein